MSVISDLIKKLQPLNLYSLSKTSNVYFELSVYASELENINSSIDELLKECFVQTAESYGVDNIESIYMSPNINVDIVTRRKRILNRLKINDSDYTVEGIKNAIKSFGGENFEILEYPSENKITINVNDSLSDTHREFIKSEIEKIMPAHNTLIVSFTV